jgi:hypothetical protein
LSRVRADSAPDSKDLEEIIRLEIDKYSLLNENERTLINLRKNLGKNLIRFLWTYFGVSTVLIIADSLPIPFHLPPGVAVALIGATAVSVLGLVGTVAAGLFRAPSQG